MPEHALPGWRSSSGGSIALQMSGHLRGLCDSDTNFAPLARLVADCRKAAARCDLFVHTWDDLYPQTPSWHTWYPSDVPNRGSSSRHCVEKLRAELRPTAVAVERQVLSRSLGNATWIVVAGRHRETHVSLAGLRTAVSAVASALELRRAHERQRRAPPYDLAVRVRPDLYHRRNFRRNTRTSYRGVPVNQICSVPAAAWPTLAAAAAAAAQRRESGASVPQSSSGGVVRGCDDETLPGNKSGDMCFWSAPAVAADRLVVAWDALADEYLQANLCWQRWRQSAPSATLPRGARARAHRVPAGGRGSDGGRGHGRGAAVFSPSPDGAPTPCAYPETQWEGSAAELILTSAARREGVRRGTLHGGDGSRFVPREAKCT